MRVIDKLFAFLVVFPPLYMLYRFVRWSMKQERETEETAAE